MFYKLLADIYAFLKEFNLILDNHKTYHEKALQLSQCFGGTSWTTMRVSSSNPTNKLHAIQPLDMKLQIDSCEEFDQDDDDGSDDFEEQLKNFEDGKLLAMSRQDVQEPMVCLTKVLHGECKKKDCKYSHNEQAVLRASERFFDLIGKRLQGKSKVRTAPSHSVSVLQRPQDALDASDN